jgi:hypothetical protein
LPHLETLRPGLLVKKSNYNLINIEAAHGELMENKTARLTVLIDPARKEAFEKLCHAQDMTPSQVMRRLIRDFLTEHGVKFTPAIVKKARK